MHDFGSKMQVVLLLTLFSIEKGALGSAQAFSRPIGPVCLSGYKMEGYKERRGYAILWDISWDI